MKHKPVRAKYYPGNKLERNNLSVYSFVTEKEEWMQSSELLIATHQM